MKTIVRIARLELSLLFYSPIAWFLALVFLVECGITYTGNIQFRLMMQDVNGQRIVSLGSVTRAIFSDTFSGMYATIAAKAFLYIPLLTMGLISREMSSGTIKLLYSSPIRIRQIVLGKFLAMMFYNLLLICLVSIFAIFGHFNIPSADIGLILSGLLGIYLLLCAYSAIGLFMSCLSTYQIVAAIGTLVLLSFFSYIGEVWQDIDFVRDITYILSMNGRATHMMQGLISTKDILYFVVIIYIFLGLSVCKLKSSRETTSGRFQAGRYALLVLSGIALGYIGSKPRLIGYVDVTSNQSMTISKQTQEILKKFGSEPLEITSYINLNDDHYWDGQPSQRNIDMARWEPYLRFKPDIKFNYVYYYDSSNADLFKFNPGKNLKEIAESRAKSFRTDLHRFKTPEEIKNLIDLSAERHRYVMQIRYRNKTEFLRVFDDQIRFPLETETAAAFKRLLVKAPKAVFLKDEFERSADKLGDGNYQMLTNELSFRNALINQGFDVQTISLRDQFISQDIAVLVIADPRSVFFPESLEKIKQYIKRGGNLLVLGEKSSHDALFPILNELGVDYLKGNLAQKDNTYPVDMIMPLLTPWARDLSQSLKRPFKDSEVVTMKGATGLVVKENMGFTVNPLLRTNGRYTWNKKRILVLDSAEVSFDAQAGDTMGSFMTALAMSRPVNGKDQRIVVAGDADFLSNVELRRPETANFAFSTALFGWFSQGAFPLDVSVAEPADSRVGITNEGISKIKIWAFGILPGLLLIGAALFLIRRRRK